MMIYIENMPMLNNIINVVSLFGFLAIIFYVCKRILDRADQQLYYIMNSRDRESFTASFKTPPEKIYKPSHMVQEQANLKADEDIAKDDAWDKAYIDGHLTDKQAKLLGID